VSFEMEQEDWQLFMDAATSGMILDCVMVKNNEQVQVKEPKPVKKKGDYSDFAKWLYSSGVMRMPLFWGGVGSEKQHKEWIQQQPCVICGERDLASEATGDMRCEEAHVRTSENAGIGYKPPYLSVPMCHADHQLQHTKGYKALLDRYLAIHDKVSVKPDMKEEWIIDMLKTKAITLIEEWAKSRLYEHFSIESLTEMSPGDFVNFCELTGLEDIRDQIPERFLPPGDVDAYF